MSAGGNVLGVVLTAAIGIGLVGCEASGSRESSGGAVLVDRDHEVEFSELADFLGVLRTRYELEGHDDVPLVFTLERYENGDLVETKPFGGTWIESNGHLSVFMRELPDGLAFEFRDEGGGFSTRPIPLPKADDAIGTWRWMLPEIPLVPGERAVWFVWMWMRMREGTVIGEWTADSFKDELPEAVRTAPAAVVIWVEPRKAE